MLRVLAGEGRWVGVLHHAFVRVRACVRVHVQVCTVCMSVRTCRAPLRACV